MITRMINVYLQFSLLVGFIMKSVPVDLDMRRANRG